MTGTVAGVDGYRDGWVIAIVTLSSKNIRFTLADTFANVVASTADCHRVGVDMPQALPLTSLRASDQEIKDYLGSGGRSLFWTMTRAALDQDSHAEAVVVNKANGGKGPSAQGWGLARKIREVRTELLTNPNARVFETHPESSFTAMNGDTLMISKKSGAGAAKRLQLLSMWSPNVLNAAAAVGNGPVLDDLLDAAAAAWSAARVHVGTARWFGAGDVDDQGLRRGVAI